MAIKKPALAERKSNTKNRLLKKIAETKTGYEQVIDAIQDGICVITEDFEILRFNRFFAEKNHITFSELKGNNFFDVIKRYEQGALGNLCHDRNRPDCPIARAFSERKPQEQIINGIDGTGRNKYFKLNIFPARLKERREWQAVIVIRDITKSRAAEEEIRQLHEFNQRILDTAPISIAVLDAAGRIIATNERAKDLTHGREKRGRGSKLTESPEIAGNPRLLGLYKRLLQCGEAFSYENLPYFSATTQSHHCLNIIAVPLLASDKTIEGAISMAIDITDSVTAKLKLEDLNRNLEKKVQDRTKELDALNQKLNKALDLKSKFISDASHELRTPLTVIQGNLDLAFRELQRCNREAPEIYNLIMPEVERMRSILSDITLLTNADNFSEQLLYEPVDLGGLAAAVGESLKILADQKNIKFTFRPGIKKLVIMGDEQKLEKLLLNIVRNAIKYTDPGGKVRVWIEKDEAETRINVEDNGIGIPEKDLPLIFERFYRVDKARSRAEGGTGIGLSIAKWVAEAHSGSITVESRLGAGSKFTVHLPFNYKNQPQKSLEI